ncbi:MAG: formate dehydrogenase accessory sulfurtransferase FdhD [Rubrivivax sp.]
MSPSDIPPEPPGVRRLGVVAWRSGHLAVVTDAVAEEVPVALVFNGISYAVMMASPADLEDFALGFGLSEGLLASPGELHGVESVELTDGGAGWEVHLAVAAACEWRLKERRRTLAGRTGCGLCGTESLQQLRRELPACPAVELTPAALARAHRELRARQVVQQVTGASHAAAWCGTDGAVLLAREDVGRHNALDKLIGAMTTAGIDPATGFVFITSRASFEMVQKAAMAGAGALVAVSAPTALAVDTALGCGLALAGFARDDDFVAYTQAQRFGLPVAG